MALAHAILAALINAPCSGYDLAKRFDGSVGFFLVSQPPADLSRAVKARRPRLD